MFLRPPSTADLPFTRELFEKSQGRELALLPEELRDELRSIQYDAFERSLSARAGLRDTIVELDGRSIGRLVVQESPDELRLVDIALVETERGKGLGTRLVARVIAEADGLGLPLRGHVRADSRARALYARLGFVDEGVEGPFVAVVRWPTTLAGRPVIGSARASDHAFLARPGVVPIRVAAGRDEALEFVELGSAPFQEAFFDESVLRAMRELGRQPERRTIGLQKLVHAPEFEDSIPLAGIVFHVSRCGSTLITRAIASDEANHVIAEADPIDFVVRRASAREPRERQSILRALVRAYSRRRSQRTERLILKLDAWHLRSLPLFREAFPDVPLVVVVRDPLEVIASHRARRGGHVVPGLFEPGYLGVGVDEFAPHELDRYACLVLKGFYESAKHAQNGGAMLVRYEELPGAIIDSIAPHFGIAHTASIKAGIDALSGVHVKLGDAFVPDSESKRRSVPDEVRALVDALARPAYEAL